MCNVAIGNKYLEQNDIRIGRWLTLRRFYNSDGTAAPGSFGAQWRGSFDRSLALSAATSSQPATMVITRPDSKIEVFTKTNGQWAPTSDVADTLTETDNASGSPASYMLFMAALRHLETYDASGNLLSVTDQTGVGVTLTYSTATTAIAIAPHPGLPITIQDPNGRTLQLIYNGQGLVSQITLPDGGVISYGYNTTTNNLTSVTYPDGKVLTYVYNESSLTSGASLPNALTGIVDESGTRYEDTFYDATGRATQTRQGQTLGADDTQITYTSGGAKILFPLGVSSTVSLTTTVQGLSKVSAMSQPCGSGCEQPYTSRSYDANGYPSSVTDWNSNVTKTTYDANGLLDQQIDASGTSNQRTTTTTWNTILRVPLTRIVLDANNKTVSSTQWTYNAAGQVLARCDIDPTNSAASAYACSNTGTAPVGVRRWTYTYCAAVDTTQCPLPGLLLTATDPNGHTTRYAYYLTDATTHRHGDLYQVTDPMNLVTTYLAYDGAGRLLAKQRPDGVYDDYTYTPRGWLQTHTERVTADNSAASSDATTTYAYTPYGALQSVTDPDGVAVTYGYDAAHRLTDITDALGQRIHYTLDAAGDRTQEQWITASGSVVASLSRQYNTLGQLTQVTNGQGQVVFNASASGSYDGNNNLLHYVDGNGVAHAQSFDALDRLQQIIDDVNGTSPATANATTTKVYDALDRLTQVTDPSKLVTTYTYDGLGNLTALQSPDTGTSRSTYDAAGNVLSHTDARGVLASYSYDADNRLSAATYTNPVIGKVDPSLNVSYGYDQANSLTGCAASYPSGRLTSVVEASAGTIYCYSGHGNVSRKTQVVGSTTDVTQYGYSPGDRLTREVLPSGTALSYTLNTDNGAQATLTVTPPGGAAVSVVSASSWNPFGPISSYTLGGINRPVARSYDADYAVSAISGTGFGISLTRDAMGNVTGEGDGAESYTLDAQSRLTQITEASGSALETLTYNPTGDRLSKTGGGGYATGAYGYKTNTHQLTSTGSYARSVDAAGNTTAATLQSGLLGLGYNGRDRLSAVTQNGTTVASYLYNAQGQRIQKTVGSAATRFDYDESGQLVAEYGGATSKDYLWFNGIPVGIVDGTGGSTPSYTVNYVLTDQINTPRAVVNPSGTTIWSWAWLGNPFGEKAPSSTGGYVLNLRYPGQYFDAETGTNYNMFRTYDPATGRFLQPDPFGFNGGIGLYVYGLNNPLVYIDPTGRNPGAGVLGGLGGGVIEFPWWAAPAAGIGAAAVGGYAIGTEINNLWGNQLSNAIWNATHNATPDIPGDIVGNNPQSSSGKRINTDLPADAFPETWKDLTGNNSTQVGDHQVCPNGVRARPGKAGEGPRIDIPGNGSKPPETIHFPKGTAWPW